MVQLVEEERNRAFRLAKHDLSVAVFDPQTAGFAPAVLPAQRNLQGQPFNLVWNLQDNEFSSSLRAHIDFNGVSGRPPLSEL